MSLVGALSTAISGLKVAQLQVQNSANNIANASDPNFTKKTALQVPINLAGTGGGVQIQNYTRAINLSLNRTYTTSITTNAFNTQQNEAFSDIKDLYGISSDTTRLSSGLSDFVGAWQAYSSAPEDSVRQRQVISAGNSFATEIRRISTAIATFDDSLFRRQGEAVAEVNTILERLETLNNQVASAQSVNQDSGNLQDQRDSAVRELAQYMNINVIQGNQGRIRILTASGYVLLDQNPVEIRYGVSGYEAVSDGTNLDAALVGGKLQALKYMRDDSSPSAPNTDPGREVIRKLRSQLNELATSFIDTAGVPTTFAAAYNTGAALNGELATGFFTGTDSSDIAVNAALLNGSSRLKSTSASAVVDALIDNTRDFTADGLTVNNTSYVGFTSSMLGLIGSAASSIQGRFELSDAAEQTYKQRFANAIGVNVDEELVNLTRYQNSYGASARVITVVQDMFRILDSVVGG
jgi:flagellar hook-associated protein 1 FlgK